MFAILGILLQLCLMLAGNCSNASVTLGFVVFIIGLLAQAYAILAMRR